MRVLLAGTGVQPIPPVGYGGIERVLAEYATALRSAGHTPIVINRVRNRRMSDEYLFAGELVREARRTEYDILHASTPVVANRLALAGLPYCYTTHSRHWFYRERLTHRWGYWLERRAVRKAGAAVALTATLREEIERSVGASRLPPMRVIPIGVDTEKFRPAWDRRTGRNALGVGVVLPFKRWEIAAEALRGTGIALRIAGPMPDSAYAARVKASGSDVELLGEVGEEELARLYAESDILVHPSQVELLAGAVVQGLSAGLPVLGGSPVSDLVTEGRTGWTTPASAGPREIANAWHERALLLASDPAERRRMGESARAAALERFAWPRVVAAHVALYGEMRAKE